MKPKEEFVIKGPNRSFLMHVTSSKDSMVNPLRIVSCDQKEAISGSEIGADTSLTGMLPPASSDSS